MVMNTLTPQEIELKIAQTLSIEHLGEDERTALITHMSTILLDRITLALLSEVPDADMQRINTLLDAGQESVAQSLLLKLVPHAPTIIEEIIATTIHEYNSELAKINNT